MIAAVRRDRAPEDDRRDRRSCSGASATSGYPYVWGGEWGLATPEPSGLGGQPVAGFDCSGFSWWPLRANDGGIWNIAPPRPYAGWQLPQRSSADMARSVTKFDQLVPGDLMFYDGDDDGIVDHVDMYIGNGFSLDSSRTPGGVTIMWVGDGWYRDHFVHGRGSSRVGSEPATRHRRSPPGAPPLVPGERPRPVRVRGAGHDHRLGLRRDGPVGLHDGLARPHAGAAEARQPAAHDDLAVVLRELVPVVDAHVRKDEVPARIADPRSACAPRVAALLEIGQVDRVVHMAVVRPCRAIGS